MTFRRNTFGFSSCQPSTSATSSALLEEQEMQVEEQRQPIQMQSQPDAVISLVEREEGFEGFDIIEQPINIKPLLRGRGRGRPRGSRGAARGAQVSRAPRARGRGRGRGAARGRLHVLQEEEEGDDEYYEEEEEDDEEDEEPAQQTQMPAGFQPFLELVNQLLTTRAAPVVPPAPVLKVPEYDGSQCYTMFRAQFVAITAGLTKEEQGARLLAALRGKAMMVLPMLDQQQKEPNFDNLDTILTKTFSSVRSLWERKREFETLQQQPDQKIQHFAQEVERVGREYMVTHAEPDLQEALVTAFVKGLADKTAADRLAYAPCNTLEEAVRHLNRGLLLSAQDQSTKKVRFVETGVHQAEVEVAQATPATDVNAQLNEIMKKLKTLTSNTASVNSFEETTPGTSNSTQTSYRGRGRGRGRPRGRGRGGRGGNSNNSFVCHNCGKPGHYAADCYSRPAATPNAQTCHYCKRPGHVRAECRKKLRDEQQGSHPYNSMGIPQFPQDALRAAMAYYQFQTEANRPQQNPQQQGRVNGSSGSQSSIVFPFVPQSGPSNQGN